MPSPGAHRASLRCERSRHRVGGAGHAARPLPQRDGCPAQGASRILGVSRRVQPMFHDLYLSVLFCGVQFAVVFDKRNNDRVERMPVVSQIAASVLLPPPPCGLFVFWGVSTQYMWLHAGATCAQRRPLNAPQSGPRLHLQGTDFQPFSSLRPVAHPLSQSACGLSVTSDYHAFAKYNLHSTAARRSGSTTITTN